MKILKYWILFPWQCKGSWWEWKAHSKSFWMFAVHIKGTRKHVQVCRCACLGWIVMSSGYLQTGCVWMEKWKKANQKVHLIKAVNLVLHVSLRLSHISTCRERRGHLFAFYFVVVKSSPAALLSSSWHVLFEQLQQGNVSTAFQAQAMCGSVFYQAFHCFNTDRLHTACSRGKISTSF